jgi:tRNA uridine 5-carbamoylmethylation protein Kti12
MAIDDDTSVTVILFGGLPASGKSTLARTLQNHVSSSSRKIIHLEYDAFEDQIASNQQKKDRIAAWNQARQRAIQHLQDIVQQEQESCPKQARPLLVLMDDNFHLRGMRKQIHRFLLNYQPINFGIIWMETPLKLCLQRNQCRDRPIPEDVVYKMHQTLEPPCARWEQCWIASTEATSTETIVAFIQNCSPIQDLPPDKIDSEKQERDRIKTLENQRHSWDKLLRSWVSSICKFDKRLARSTNKARKGLLLRMKDTSSVITTDSELLTVFVNHIILDSGDTAGDDLGEALHRLLQNS